jgi:hypothetical protein
MKHQGLSILFMIFSLFSAEAAETLDMRFWKWFQEHEETLFYFEKDQERVFDVLAAEMHKVHPDLAFEFGPVEDGRREFVISADGIKAAFPAVESLYASAPKLKRWTFIKFRPRRPPMGVEYGGVKVKVDDVFFTLQPDGGKAGITIHVRGYESQHQKVYKGIALLMLDQALGEYDVETKVGFIEVKSLDETTPLQQKPLKDLPKVFDEFMKYLKKSG